jgi:MoxR-like ATPase
MRMAVNATAVSAGLALEVLRAGWRAQAAGGLTASWMLHGRPGVGKSALVAQLAAETGARLFDLRLTTIEPQDLRGLPHYDHEARKTRWYRPEDLPDDPARPAILFLDELTAAAPWLQPTVYGLLQERRVGPHRLPDTVFIVAAGNGAEDGAIAYEMGSALSDRLIHLAVRAEPGDWLENYALPRGLHPAVVAFIRTRPDLLETIEEAISAGRTIATTPRSWERASDILRAVPQRNLRAVMLAGTLGAAVAADFLLVADDIAAQAQVAEVLAARPADRAALYPASMHGLYGLIYGLVGVADAARIVPVVEVMAGLRHLAQGPRGADFAALPMAELCTHGFEMLSRRALAHGFAEEMLAIPAYADYAAERQALGLE